MTKRIDRNRNTSDETTILDGIALNATTSTTIFAANTERVRVVINNNDSNFAVFIKEQAASVDNDLKGYYLARKGGSEPYKTDIDNPYTGEISAIAESGTPVVFGQER